MKKLFLLSMIVLLGFSACKKDKKVTPEKTRADYLTAAPWTFETVGDTIPDPCMSDDEIVFKTDGTMTVDFGLIQCPGGLAGKYDGSWQLFDSDTKLNFSVSLNGLNLVDTLNIIKLDENTFEFIGNTLFDKTKMKH